MASIPKRWIDASVEEIVGRKYGIDLVWRGAASTWTIDVEGKETDDVASTLIVAPMVRCGGS